MEGANRLRGSGLDSSFGVPTLSFFFVFFGYKKLLVWRYNFYSTKKEN